MEEKKKSDAPSNKVGGRAESGGTPKRDQDATSTETLSDLEESEKVSNAGSGGSEGSPLEGSSPRPSTTEGGGRADGSDTGGPM